MPPRHLELIDGLIYDSILQIDLRSVPEKLVDCARAHSYELAVTSMWLRPRASSCGVGFCAIPYVPSFYSSTVFADSVMTNHISALRASDSASTARAQCITVLLLELL